LLFILLLAVGAQATPLVPPQTVRIDIVFLRTKNDGIGIDRRIDAKLATTLKNSSKGGPLATPPFNRFDNYDGSAATPGISI
jgi:hypothetical protein